MLVHKNIAAEYKQFFWAVKACLHQMLCIAKQKVGVDWKLNIYMCLISD